MRKNMLKFVTKGQSQTVNLFLKSTKKGPCGKNYFRPTLPQHR